MANNNKFIVKNGLTTNNISFVDDIGNPANTITASMSELGTLSFDGRYGQLFSITDSLTGTIFSVNDISGIPSIEVDNTGTIRLAELSGNVLVGTSVDNGTSRLQVDGELSAVDIQITGKLSASGSSGTAGQVLSTDGTTAFWSTEVGYAGSQGTTGYTGSQGIPGDVGYTGSQGYTGSAGTDGSDGGAGAIGFTGSQGTTGYTGSRGIQGVIGFTGSAGTDGTDGGAGAIGFTGSQGIQGVIGFTGSQGYTGSRGIQGIQGVIGFTGSQGDIGYTGSQGAGATWIIKSSAYTAENGDAIIADVSAGSWILTLPASPSAGDVVIVSEGAGDFSTAPLTVARNGSTIEGVADNLAIDVQDTLTHLVYDGATWQVYSSVGKTGYTGSQGYIGSQGVIGYTGSQGEGADTPISDDTTTDATRYLTLTDTATGTLSSIYVSSSKLYFNPFTGQLNATEFNSLSDESAKENITLIENALSTIQEINGYSFEWRDTKKKSLGVVAQKLEQVVPSLVNNVNEHKTVNYNGLIALLIEAVKELNLKVDNNGS